MSSQPALSPQADTLAEGTKIGFYTVLGRADATGRVVTRVSQGSFGVLYRVRHEGEEAELALKISKVSMAQMTPFERQRNDDRFRREVSVLLALSHPNIVKVHGFDYWPTRAGHPFLVMDFVEGQPLYEWQQALKPSLRSICEV